MLNVTEDVAMIFHKENLLHLLKMVVILFLRLFWYISLLLCKRWQGKRGHFENYPLSETNISGTAIGIG